MKIHKLFKTFSPNEMSEKTRSAYDRWRVLECNCVSHEAKLCARQLAWMEYCEYRDMDLKEIADKEKKDVV